MTLIFHKGITLIIFPMAWFFIDAFHRIIRVSYSQTTLHFCFPLPTHVLRTARGRLQTSQVATARKRLQKCACLYRRSTDLSPRTKQFRLLSSTLSMHTWNPMLSVCTSINFSAPHMKQSIDWFYKDSCEWRNLLAYSFRFWSTYFIFYCPPLWYRFLH